MGYNSIEELFTTHMSIEITDKLYKDIKTFRVMWVNKKEEHIEFLGSNTLGVYSIKYTPADESEFFNILKVDGNYLQKELYTVKGVNKDFKTVSNITYVTLVYLLHKFLTNKTLKKDVIEDACKELYYLINYKMFSSILNHYFKYTIDVSVSKAVTERLNAKYLIKKFNNWQAVFEYKSRDVLPGGIHFGRIVKGTTEDIIRVIMDTQTKLRDIVKNIYAVFMEVVENNDKVSSTTLVETREDEEETIKALSNRQDSHYNVLLQLLPNINDFIVEELVLVLCGIFKSVNKHSVIEMLKYTSENFQTDKDLSSNIEGIFHLYFDYLLTKNISKGYSDVIYEIIMLLKGYYVSQKTRNKDFANYVKYFTGIVKKHLKVSNITTVSNILNVYLIYLLVRAFYKRQ